MGDNDEGSDNDEDGKKNDDEKADITLAKYKIRMGRANHDLSGFESGCNTNSKLLIEKGSMIPDTTNIACINYVITKNDHVPICGKKTAHGLCIAKYVGRKAF